MSFTIQDKKKIVEKMNKLKKEHYEFIYKNILLQNNIKFNKNSSGVYFNIGLLNDKVLIELNNYINSILNQEIVNQESNNSIESVTNSQNNNNDNSRINRLSNHEKNILKRNKQHPKYEESESITENNDSDIFNGNSSIVYTKFE